MSRNKKTWSIVATLLLICIGIVAVNFKEKALKLAAVHQYSQQFATNQDKFDKRDTYRGYAPTSSTIKIDTALASYLEAQIANFDTSLLHRKRSLADTKQPQFIRTLIQEAERHGGLSAAKTEFVNRLWNDQVSVGLTMQFDTAQLNFKETITRSNEYWFNYTGPVKMTYNIIYNGLTSNGSYYFIPTLSSPIRLKQNRSAQPI